ncbi:MAG: FAD-binding protein, partial [Dehalococcoidia bacterium]|nr:FAD-binding protein [Dehalococcoidia bacterium]
MGVKIMNDVFVFDLLHRDGVVTGALGLDLRSGEPIVIRAKAVILATGGYMGSYPRTMVPMATGDGTAMAYRAGVEVADMEMADFYTYVAVWPPPAKDEEWPALLVYNLNATMYNSLGEEYMKRYTGPRRVPPRAAAAEIRAGRCGPHGGVYISVRHLPVNLVKAYLDSLGRQRFLNVLTSWGFDLINEALEVVPAAITSFGGCRINSRCETNLAGLYAAGEVASGHQGAYVMVGNMVGTSSATGHIAAEQAVKYCRENCLAEARPHDVTSRIQEIMKFKERLAGGCRPVRVRKTVKTILDRYAHIAGRTDAGLRQGLAELDDVEKNLLPNMRLGDDNPHFNSEWVQALEAVNQVQIARLILISALERTESRGVHHRDDYPEESHDWLKRIVIRRINGRDEVHHEPLKFTHIGPPERPR